MLGTKPGEIKALFKQTLGVDRSGEIKEQMLAAGLPIRHRPLRRPFGGS